MRAFTLRRCPGGEKSARIQAETLLTRVCSCRCDCESAVAGGNISRSLPGVRGIRFELELELELFSLILPHCSPRGEGENPSPTAAGSPRNGAPSLPRFGLPAGRRESILMATGPFNLLARSRLSRDGRRGGWAPSALSGGRPGMGGRPVCRFRRRQVSSRGCAAARGLAAPR